MAAGDFVSYDSFQEYIADGTIDADDNTFKMLLFSSSSNFNTGTHTVLADLTNELSTANGYTAGGLTLTSVTWTRSSGRGKFTSDAAVWNATGAGLTARGAVIIRSGTVNGVTDALVARCLLDSTPADITVASGGELRVTPHSNGWFRIGRGTIT